MSDKPFCAAPWIHLHMRSDGRFSPCCHMDSTGPKFLGSAEDYWNSEPINSLRLQMIAGTPPKACSFCTSNSSFRQPNEWHNFEASRLGVDLTTHPDGSVAMKPVSYDLRNHVCNLACIPCNPGNSSKLNTLSVKIGRPSVTIHKSPETILTESMVKTVNKVYWAGGEPLVSPLHWSTMEQLLASSIDPIVYYNTNLLVTEKVYSRWLELLPKFSNVEVGASYDGFGEIGEYLRTDAKHDLFFARLDDLVPRIKALSVAYTLTNIGLLCFADLISHLSTRPGIRLTLRVVRNSPFLDVRFMKPDLVSTYLDEAAALASGTHLEEDVFPFIAYVRGFIAAPTDIVFSRKQLEDNERMRGREGFFFSRMAGMLKPELETPYCIAPWVSSHVTSDGHRSPCCVIKSSSQLNYADLDEYWNSKEVRTLRLQLLSQEPPKDCSVCTSKVRALPTSKILKNEFGSEIIDVVNTTDATGRTTLTPRLFEVKHIVCNLKCRHCGPTSSSSIRTQYQKKNIPIRAMGSMYSGMKIKNTDLQRCDASTKLITWTGGEPFMSPLLQPALEDVIQRGLMHIKQSFVTNGMVLPSQRVFSLLRQFKPSNISISLSLDGLGDYGRFQRVGFDEETFTSNLSVLKKELPGCKFRVLFTFTSVSALGLPDVVRFCIKHELAFSANIMNAPPTHYLRMELLRPDIVDSILAEASILNPSSLSLLVQSVRDTYVPMNWTEAHEERLTKDNELLGQDMNFHNLFGWALNA